MQRKFLTWSFKLEDIHKNNNFIQNIKMNEQEFVNCITTC
jgi:hypothetical protein